MARVEEWQFFRALTGGLARLHPCGFTGSSKVCKVALRTRESCEKHKDLCGKHMQKIEQGPHRIVFWQDMCVCVCAKCNIFKDFATQHIEFSQHKKEQRARYCLLCSTWITTRSVAPALSSTFGVRSECLARLSVPLTGTCFTSPIPAATPVLRRGRWEGFRGFKVYPSTGRIGTSRFINELYCREIRSTLVIRYRITFMSNWNCPVHTRNMNIEWLSGMENVPKTFVIVLQNISSIISEVGTRLSIWIDFQWSWHRMVHMILDKNDPGLYLWSKTRLLTQLWWCLTGLTHTSRGSSLPAGIGAFCSVTDFVFHGPGVRKCTWPQHRRLVPFQEPLWIRCILDFPEWARCGPASVGQTTNKPPEGIEVRDFSQKSICFANWTAMFNNSVLNWILYGPRFQINYSWFWKYWKLKSPLFPESWK